MTKQGAGIQRGCGSVVLRRLAHRRVLRHPVHTPLTAFAPPYAEAKGAWIPACAGMTKVAQE